MVISLKRSGAGNQMMHGVGSSAIWRCRVSSAAASTSFLQGRDVFHQLSTAINKWLYHGSWQYLGKQTWVVQSCSRACREGQALNSKDMIDAGGLWSTAYGVFNPAIPTCTCTYTHTCTGGMAAIFSSLTLCKPSRILASRCCIYLAACHLSPDKWGYTTWFIDWRFVFFLRLVLLPSAEPWSILPTEE